MKTVGAIARYLLGLTFFVFGSNMFLHLIRSSANTYAIRALPFRQVIRGWKRHDSSYFTRPAAFSNTTLLSTAVSTVSGRCEQKPMPT
jgi:hypothetical protein